jgi:uncharacterized tellurite resistance protein B-like protein
LIPLDLTDKEKTDYLANLWLVARADKALSDQEETLIAEVQKSIQAKRAHNTAAQKAVETGQFSLSNVGSFAGQVQNLEDMIAVALVDSDLAGPESDVITSFCNLIGIRQDQLDVITSDASKRIKTRTGAVTCIKCGAQMQSDARFCPACGAPVETGSPATTTPLEFDIPKTGYAITFSESTAPSFATALELSKQLGPVQTALKNKKTWYLVSIPSDRFLELVRIAKALLGIRNRAIYYEGQQVDWDDVFGFMWCADQRDHAYNPLEYCFGKDENRINPWSCKQSRMDWTEWADWFSQGAWQNTGTLSKRNVWRFDKERIRHNLLTNIHRFRFCPYLRYNFIEAVLSSIPEEVEVTDTSPWKYNVIYEELPGSIKIVEREGEGEFTYNREYYADGVRPRGLLPLKEVFARAFEIAEDKPEIPIEALVTK